MSRIILMGDPGCFRIRAGANPHTRTRWGWRKRVDLGRARGQWDQVIGTFRDLGLRVEVLPPVENAPGLVFPANAGFLACEDRDLPLPKRNFYLSNLLPGRAAEKEIYRKFISALGFCVHDLGTSAAFEGEADFFPAGEGYLFTYGKILRQRWAPALGWPPYRRRYGFRSHEGVQETLRGLLPGEKIIPLELSREAYYHGDTVACAVGPRKEYLLLYAGGVTPESLERLKRDFTGRLILLSQGDVARFAANSFHVDRGGDQLLFCPVGLSEELLGTVRDLGIRPVPLDVSEFFTKGGGSIKCMLCDLGNVVTAH